MSQELFNRIKQIAFPENQYYKEETEKSQIYLHHTVSPGASVNGDLQYWLSTTVRVATHVIISQDGTINQMYNSSYWGYHLGLDKSVFAKAGLAYKSLDRISLAIELDSLGPVDVNGNSIAYGSRCKTANIQHYADKYRGYEYFETYTEKQLESLGLLLTFWCDKFNIDKTFNGFDLSTKALKGVNGIYSHTSVRPDKSDVHPQPELVKLLSNL
jgi:N-acetyl-anhydromuramyl-L-alanine amidase AmpD